MSAGGWRRAAGTVALRVLVPAWVLLGATVKLLSGAPSELPEPVIRAAGALGIDLAFVLHYAVAVELVVVGTIWLLPRFARAAALALLGLFAAILAWETALGSASCGCFGSVTVPPWVTLVVDGSLLVLVAWLAPRGCEAPPPTSRRTAAALLWTLAAFLVAFGAPALGAGTGAAAPRTGGAAGAGAGPAALPDYYVPDYGSWIGRRWEELDLARWLPPLPEALRSGTAYVILYRRDCPHCHQLMELYFAGDPPFPTLLVAVPEREGFPQPTWENPCTGCREVELPVGPDWFFATPVVVRLEDGVVECAAEERPEAPQCVLQ